MNRISAVVFALGVAALPIRANADSNDLVAGAIVGALAGAAIAGSVPEQHREPLREYIVRENRPSYRHEDDVVVGRLMPRGEYESYDVPDQYEMPRHRYTIINDRPVIYHPDTRRIIHVYE